MTRDRHGEFIAASLNAIRNDPWRRRVDHCPACKGEGRIYWARALGGGHWADCDECDGTGNGDKDTNDE